MREGRIVAPVWDARLEYDLMRAFGGYTRIAGDGSWWDDKDRRTVKEMVYVYDVAASIYPSHSGPTEQLVEIAQQYGARNHQKEVYVRGFSGEVSFVDTRTHVVDSLTSFGKEAVAAADRILSRKGE